MEERSESSKFSRTNKTSPSHSRKNKKRSSRKNSVNIENWCEEAPINHNGAPVPTMDYRQMFWQQSAMPPHLQRHNGQRLFAAMSDPSVCGYSAVPMAYTMEPISVPPIYPMYQPISRPNYRTYRGRPRRNVAQNNHGVLQTHGVMTNGYSSLQENRSNYSNPPAYRNGDYASLPPTANNETVDNHEELNSEQRRYSDPGLGPADLPHPTNSDESDSGESGSSITTIGKNNKLVLSLVMQMNVLRETNSQMFKELHETKNDLENMKSEMARFKHGGTTDYQPGMLSDIVRKMREANKVLDEAMITKVNVMVDEQNRQRTMEFEKLRDQLNKMSEEKDESYRRIAKLEDEVAALKLNANNEGLQIAAFEEETLALRRELQEARASKNLAENHAAKCVNALARPLTPVTFETPCITSTPVRTELKNDPYTSPSRPVSANDFSDSSTKTLVRNSRESESRSRRDSTSSSPQDLNFYRVSSFSPSSSPSTSSSPSDSSRCDDRDVDTAEIDDEWRWRATTVDQISESTEQRENRPVTLLSDDGMGIIDRSTNESDKHESRKHKDYLADVPEVYDESDTNERLIVFSSRDYKDPGETTKPRARKSGNVTVKRVYDMANKFCNSTCEKFENFVASTTTTTAMPSNETPDVVDDTSIETGDPTGPNDDGKKSRKHAITEVPDVIVVAGKPVVPKDLCSTRILTSRVLTRATYTTAYI